MRTRQGTRPQDLMEHYEKDIDRSIEEKADFKINNHINNYIIILIDKLLLTVIREMEHHHLLKIKLLLFNHN